MAAWQEEEMAVPFDPCNMWESIPAATTVLVIGELPAAFAVGIGEECPARWTATGYLRAAMHTPRYRSNRVAEASLAASLCVLVALQWFLIGGLPLIDPRRWWWEPGAFVTVVIVVAFLLVLVPGVRELAPFLMLFALLGWLYWFVLLVWKSGRACWLLATHRLTLTH
jgi:hypothetical protein